MADVKLTGAPESEFSFPFVQGMADRMAMSYFKYGLVRDAYPSKIDALASLDIRLQKYRETGNTEFLMDAANFAMIEYMHPKIEGAYFKPTDSHESPGRKWAGGTQTQYANTESQELKRQGKTFYKREGD